VGGKLKNWKSLKLAKKKLEQFFGGFNFKVNLNNIQNELLILM
jgi:hypothetical protein